MTFKKMLFAFLFIYGQSTVFAQEKSKLELKDLFNLEYISDPQISPDGTQIVYIRNFKDVMTDRDYANLWISNIDGSRVRQLTQGNQRDYAPLWSNDGKKIVFLSNQDDSKVKLYLMFLDTRETIVLTNTAIPPGAAAWSPDDRQLAFTQWVPEVKKSLLTIPAKPEGAEWNAPPIYIDEMNYRSDGSGYAKPGKMQIFTLGIEGGTPRQRTFTSNNHGNPIWAKDSQSLFFSANLHEKIESEPNNSEIYQLQLTNGTIKALTTRFGPDTDMALSPDGKKIAYIGNDDTFQGYQVTHLYVMNVDGTGVKNLTAGLDRDASNPQWEGNGQGVYFQYDEMGATKIGHVSLTGKVRTIVEGLGGLDLGRPYVAGTFTASNNNRFAFTQGGADYPADLAVWNTGETKRITTVNDDLFSYRKIGKTQEIW
jgi:Tol biopolymer transport system component